MATIKEVANKAAVSLTTVSRVLNRDDSQSVTPEVKMRIYQAAHQLNYMPPRLRKAASIKKKIIIGVADWQILRPGRTNIRLSSLSSMLYLMNNQYEATFVRLSYGQPQEVDGIIALGLFNEEELAFLRSLSYAIVFVNSHRRTYENDQVQLDFDLGLEEMVDYLLVQKRYASIGYIGGLFHQDNVSIGSHRLNGLKKILEN